ncbi:tail terminator [Klebsiella phage TSK1]|uniref:Uncharacterized protein n=1 Tax=Klebsiella phage TSK1 TaxID=2301532 RepID=A0A3S7R1X0_9CAUD|nr:tail terminator [Klebsiella phage TSK1]AXN53790.1 hypothetical protein [Klebsiella phage TSK1]
MGMVQIDVIFKPGNGTDHARLIAQNVAKYFPEGEIIDPINKVYVSEWAEVHGVHKHETGWFFPVRFTVRCNRVEENGYPST